MFSLLLMEVYISPIFVCMYESSSNGYKITLSHWLTWCGSCCQMFPRSSCIFSFSSCYPSCEYFLNECTSFFFTLPIHNNANIQLHLIKNWGELSKKLKYSQTTLWSVPHSCHPFIKYFVENILRFQFSQE